MFGDLDPDPRDASPLESLANLVHDVLGDACRDGDDDTQVTCFAIAERIIECGWTAP